MAQTPSSARRYLLVFGVLTGLSLSGLAAVNWLMDPYGIFGTPLIPGVNGVKHGFTNHLRLAKAHAVKAYRPATVILGSSRAETSLDPAHPGFRQQPVYNLAMSGAGMYEVYRYLQHAQAVGPLREAVVALDFFMFNGDWRPQGDFSEERLAVNGDGQPTRQAGEIATLLSASATRDSWFSWRQQNSGTPSYLPNGLRDGRVDLPNIRAAGGHRKAFRANEEYFFRYGYSPQGRGFRELDRNGHAPIEWLARMLAFCRSHDIKLQVLINPVHARQYQVMVDAGLWPRYEEWKRQVVGIFTEEAARSGQAAYPLWDFGAINDITTEPVPPEGDATTEMRWYRESSHYQATLGKLMLDRLLADRASYRDAADGFGLLLSAQNIEGQLTRQRARLAHWQREHPQDVAEVEEAARRQAAARK